jgi:hypothetical protein
VARPGRQAGIELRRDRAPKARHDWRFKCRTFGARLGDHPSPPTSRPGLFSGGPSGLCFTTLIYDALYSESTLRCSHPPLTAMSNLDLPRELY